MQYNELLRTKENVYHFLVEQQLLIHWKATEALDLGNHEGAEDLFKIYALMNEIARRIAKELR